MNGRDYTPAEHHLVRKMFHQNKTDNEIACELVRQFGRRCKGEAVRKIRRTLGLKKIPLSFALYTWVPQQFWGQEVAI